MKTVFRDTAPGDLSAIAAFLQRIFGMPSDALTTKPDHLHWKYWQPLDSFWPVSSRSSVIEREGVILAHAAAWPNRILTEAGPVNTVHLIDWAADPTAVGAGMSVLKQMIRRADAAIAVGGTDMTRKVLPAIGYKRFNPIIYYARPLRPLRQAAAIRSWTARKAGAFARNLLWTASSSKPAPGWTAETTDPQTIPPHVWPRPSAGIAVFERTPERFEYLSGCPIARCTFHAVRFKGECRGYFCIFETPGVARIADAWGIDTDAWAAVYQLAADQALRMDGVAEIATAAGIDPARRALEAAGFRQRREEYLVVYNQSGSIDPNLACHFQLIDSDVAFLHAGRPDYLTL